MPYESGSLYDVLPWMDVRQLPRLWRRAFVILLPITGPLWLAAVVAQFAAMVAFAPIGLVIALCAWPVIWAVEIWKE